MLLKNESHDVYEWEFKNDKPCNLKFKKIEILANNLKLVYFG